MADLGHTPRCYPSGKPIWYRLPWNEPAGLRIGSSEPDVRGHLCTKCGCFYKPTKDAVCPNKVVQMLKETVL